jgi:hypothetical protein
MRKWYYRLCSNVGADMQVMTESAVMEKYGVTRGFVRYWGEKARDPLFHNAALGGARNNSFTPREQLMIELALWDEVQRDPFQSNTAYGRVLSARLGLAIDRRCGQLSARSH